MSQSESVGRGKSLTVMFFLKKSIARKISKNPENLRVLATLNCTDKWLGQQIKARKETLKRQQSFKKTAVRKSIERKVTPIKKPNSG